MARDSLHLTYLDTDAIIALAGEPKAKQYLLDLRAKSYIAVSATVLHELVRVREHCAQRIQALLEVAHGYSIDQCPDVLKEVFGPAPIDESVRRSLRAIEGLRVFLSPSAPQPGVFFGQAFDVPLAKLMRDAHRGFPTGNIGSFEEFFHERARLHAVRLAQLAVDRGLITDTGFVEENFTTVIQRKQVFAPVAMMLASMYRALIGRGRGRDGLFSDLRTIVETCHADALLTRDTELVECNRLVRSAFPQFPLEVRRLA